MNLRQNNHIGTVGKPFAGSSNVAGVFQHLEIAIEYGLHELHGLQKRVTHACIMGFPDKIRYFERE
jgi:hypothetical protein